MNSELLKFWYKITNNKSKYLEVKHAKREQKKRATLNPEVLKTLKQFKDNIDSKTEINLSHSGHLGDLIYALPIIKELSKTKICNLIVKVNQPYNGQYFKHPSGNIMISERSFNMLLPLLKEQSYLNSVTVYTNQTIDVDLDFFRALPISNQFHSFRWYYHLVGKQADMTLPYLDVKPHNTITDKIVIVRTFRARNVFIDYSFLKHYDNLLFLGTKDEYEDLKQSVPNLEFYDVKDFLELAQIIKSCKFYLSNQTFAYAIAEGLKVPRLLEAYPDYPVMFPTTTNGADFYFQEHFEAYFKTMYNA
ncbi:hypothetical protein [Mesoflavibacter profundi]|uniref:hypothetical protein n=1 Tax=Mesoflavibacter profundi TaxID=2708110 RepID=UPI00168AF3E5|nr:hypothetical protein [Mesoflavibacter profundi]